ncbi:SETX helicase, partial [Centropus bengalensis]|nr:SETX helicase [Centropus bengalensis]
MSTCRWCTPSGSDTTEFLKSYASQWLSPEDLEGSNDDLCYCLECVVEYHKAREKLPRLHEVLWEVETSRLIAHIEKSMQEEAGENDGLFMVDGNGEAPLSGDVGPDFENNLRVPLLEILKYPYLLLHKKLSDLCVEVLCRMVQCCSTIQVFEKYPGIYLFLVHPNEVVRRWAIATARNLGKVDRDDYYDLKEVLTCLFKVIELGLFESPDIYSSSMIEKGRLILLPSHLYDTSNYKNYWLGICMLLSVLEEQAMESLLLGLDKQNDFMQSILHTMEKETADDSTDPFWPALCCFMIILEQLGSKVWGQLIDPVQAFQTIINNESYNNEIKNIRSSFKRTKSEPVSDYDDDDDMITCSQMVYNYNTEKSQKDTGWKTAICSDYCPNMYEDMQTLASMLQSDIGKETRIHDSTFLWFIPFVQSLMDLKDLGVAYIVEVIHYLCSEIRDILNQRFQQCDKISEFFLLILVSIVELHRNKKCLHLLWISSQEWVEAVVRCAKLPAIAFTRCSEKTSGHHVKGSPAASLQPSNSVQHACLQLIRSLLREGYQIGHHALCKQYLDKLNLFLRGNLSLGWQLNLQETQELQVCLKQVIRSVKDRVLHTPLPAGNNANSTTLPTVSIKQGKSVCGDGDKMNVHGIDDLRSPLAVVSKEDGSEDRHFPTRKCAWEEGSRDASGSSTPWTSTVGLLNIKKELDTVQEYVCPENSLAAQACGNVQTSRHNDLVAGKCDTDNQCFNPNAQPSDFRRAGLENRCEAGHVTPTCVAAQTRIGSPEYVYGSGEKESNTSSSSSLKFQEDAHRLKSVFKRETDLQKSDQDRPDLSDLSNYDCKGQISKTLCINETSANSCVPSSLENKRDTANPISQIRLLPPKSESSDRLFKFSEYLKRGNNSAGMKEDFVKEVSDDDTSADAQVDRELGKLSLAAYAKSVNFPLDSSQESSAQLDISDVRRKVKGAIRSSSDADCPDNGVIVISDSSDEEIVAADKEGKTQEKESACCKKQPSASSCASDSDISKQSKMPSPPLSPEDCVDNESQCFEFETKDEIFSVWQGTQAYCMEPTQEYKHGHVSTSLDNSDSDDSLIDRTNEWGYDMHYISDDNMEEGGNLVGKQTENISHQKEADNTKEATKSTLQESASKQNAKDELDHFADKETVPEDFTLDSKLPAPGASTSNISLASKLALRKNSTCPQKTITECKVAKTIQTSPKKLPALEAAQNKKTPQSAAKNSQPGRSLPAVVPPRKVRQRPAPASTVEKLGLKKAPRQAPELSQGSSESVTQLRSHGKAAGRVGVAQKRKSQLIAPQNLSVKRNKKMLTCQDRQFLRQTRLKRTVREKNSAGSSESANKRVKVDAKSMKQKPANVELASVEYQRGEKRGKMHVSKMLSSSVSNIKLKDDSMTVPLSPMFLGISSAAFRDDKGEPSGKGCVVQPECENATSKENESKASENSDDDDDDGNLFLTQLDPVDMELCSVEESVQDTTIDSKNPEEMVTAESLQQDESLTLAKCQYKDCMEKVKNPGEYCSKHSATSSDAGHVFAKPLLPPPKPRKPLTTKIFSMSDSSRNAAFSRDLEAVKKPSPASKSKVNTAKPVVVRPPVAETVPAGNQTHKPPSSSNVLQPHISDNILQSQNRQISNVSDIFRRPAQGTYSSFLGAQQRDHSIFVSEILKWTYEMFESSQFGCRGHLLQSIVASVPVQFQGYNDYFNTFFPLMMLNAFETLAQEWIENQRVRPQSYCFNLQKIYSDVGYYTAECTANLRESDLARQLHPKEFDLVFFVVQKKKGTFGEESEMENSIMSQVGLVKRFSRAPGGSRQNEQFATCYLSLYTQCNLSFFINKQVRCMVVGSLVTVNRMFRGLLLLSRSPLAKPIINPSYQDFCPRDFLVASQSAASNMNEYNEYQKRAIETAFAMVKQHPGLPKICLIHGPPGTGKSKTIVGLLTRVLSENTRNEQATQKICLKMKPNRVLVCAPSNAAVDELMKKIILAFKGKCRNRQNPLGNCGDINLVRMGAEKAINSEVRRFSLDKQVEHRMKRRPADCDQDIQKKKEALDQQLDKLSRQRAMLRYDKMKVSQMLTDEIGRLSRERQQLASQLKEVRGHSQKVQADIILGSDIICCTLSASGGVLLESVFARQRLDPFCCVIVDEAGQSCEVETLIPLIHRCNKLVLVGDPRQLPPTVKSMEAQQYGYDQSLMARLHRHLEEQVQRNVSRTLPVVQLTVQYRMHPDICLFPSSYIYGRTLKTDKATEENRCSSDWPFQPYLIFDVGDGCEERENDSFSNPQEVKLVMELVRTIKGRRNDLGLRHIGIITPYSAQKKKIQQQLDREFQNNSAEVDTVDAFQGREKDCIIVTCVRASITRGSIGFLASLQRLNVTITRAKFSLFILGRLKTLMENRDWYELIQDAQKRGAIIKTSERSYRKDADKIMKLMVLVQPP